jgi:inositol oxygenase
MAPPIDYYCRAAKAATTTTAAATQEASEPLDIVGELKAREWRKRQRVKKSELKLKLRNCSSENDLQGCLAEASKQTEALGGLKVKGELSRDEFRVRQSANLTYHSNSVSDDEGSGALTPTSTLDKESYTASSTSSSPTNSLLLASLEDEGRFSERGGVFSSPCTYTVAEDEETVRLNRARQTVDFADKQKRKMLSSSPRRFLRVWDALSLLKSLRLSSESQESVFENSLAVAELCRKQFPEARWLHLAGLLSNLGHVTVMKEFGSKPLWKVVGEAFPVGCKFSEDISYSHFFSSNPDRRKKVFKSLVGLYKRGCGLDKLRMSWGHSEYLCTVLEHHMAKGGNTSTSTSTSATSTSTDKPSKNKGLPKQAMFLLRYQKFYSLLLPGQHYHDFMTLEDEQNLQFLIEFNRIQFEASTSKPLRQDQVDMEYYKNLVEEYFPEPVGFY